jgi:hypothetical protein
MWQMVRIETEISASVGGLSLDFGRQCRLLPDHENIQERNAARCFYSLCYMMQVVQRLRDSKGPNRISAFLPSPKDGNQSSFQNVVF